MSVGVVAASVPPRFSGRWDRARRAECETGLQSVTLMVMVMVSFTRIVQVN